MAREDTRGALENIKKRLQILEISDSSVRTIPVTRLVLDNHITDDESHKYIYVYPSHCDKTGGIVYRTYFSEDGNCEFQSGSPHDRGSKDKKDLEIKLLKAELQRKELEIRKQDNELRRLRYLESEEERSVVSDKFIDKVNTIEITASVAQQPSHYDDSLLSSHKSTFSGIALVENSVNTINGHRNSEGPHVSSHKTLRRSSTALFELFRDEMVSGKQDIGKELSLVPDFGRTDLSSECLDSRFKLHETICACLSSMQLSLGHLHSIIKLHGIQGKDSSNIDNGAVEDELFILEKTIVKLKDLCQDLGVNQLSYPNNISHQKAVEKIECQIIDRMIQKLIQDRSRIRSLENSCIEKDKKVEVLENQIQAILEDTATAMVEKNELALVVVEMNNVADKQRKQIEDIFLFNGELLERLQVNEEKAESLSRRAKDAEEESVELSKRLECLQRIIKAEKQDNESLRNKNEILKLKLSWAEFQLTQQDAALTRLKYHLYAHKECSQDEVEGTVSQYLLNALKKSKDVVEQKHRSMESEASRAARQWSIATKIAQIDDYSLEKEESASVQCRNKMTGNQLNQHQGFLDELEEKLHSMHREVSGAFKEMPKITDVL